MYADHAPDLVHFGSPLLLKDGYSRSFIRFRIRGQPMPIIELELLSQIQAATDLPELGRSPVECSDNASAYQQGYEQALWNLLSSLVPLAEQHLGQVDARFARRPVYTFIEFLERHVERATRQVGYVADGLGI